MEKIVRINPHYNPVNIKPKEEENRTKRRVSELLSELEYVLVRGYYDEKLDEDLHFYCSLPRGQKGELMRLEFHCVKQGDTLQLPPTKRGL